MSDTVENPSRARPADEIEVTPEMIGAATIALMAFYMGDGIYDLREPCLADLYRAMHESRPR
jgi:hypothetical protein